MVDKQRHTLSEENKTAIKDKIKEKLQANPYILFAFVHGSFLERELPFHDIDIAIYLDEDSFRFDYVDFCLDLSMELSSLVDINVDVHTLNNSSLGFRYEATRGELLFAIDEDACFDFIEKTRLQYFDLKPLLEENLRDLLHIS